MRYIGHSEFWSIYYSKYFFSDGYFHDSLYSKLIFHLSLIWIHWLPIGNLAHLVVAKLLYGIIAFLVLYTTYKIFRLRLSEKYSAVLICGLFFNGIVFWDLMQIKSDITCLLFLLLGFYLHQKQHHKASVVLLFMAVFSTPKVVLFLPFPMIIILNQMDWKTIWNFRTKLWLIRFLVLFSCFFATIYLNRGWHFSSALISTYSMAFRYGNDLLSEGLRVGSQEFNSFYPLNFIYFIFPTVFIFVLVAIKAKIISMPKSKIIAFLSLCIYSFVVVWYYPIKLPHFLIPIFFFLVITFVYFAHFLTTASVVSKKTNLVLKSLLLTYFVLNAAQCIRFSNLNWGGDQFKLLVQIDQLYKINPQATIVDGTGALPRAQNLPIFFGLFDDVGNTIAAKQIIKDPPDLIFFTPKVSLGVGWFNSFFKDHYVLLAPNVYTKMVSLPDHLVGDTKDVLKAIRERFHFPIHQISFRRMTSSTTVDVVEATCHPSLVEKKTWLLDEIENCAYVTFKKVSVYSDDIKNIKIYVSPWPDLKDLSTNSLGSQLNYKNN